MVFFIIDIVSIPAYSIFNTICSYCPGTVIEEVNVNVPLQAPINGNEAEVGSSGWNIANIIYNSLGNIYNFIWPGTVIEETRAEFLQCTSDQEEANEQLMESILLLKDYYREQTGLWRRATLGSASSCFSDEASYSSLSREDHFVYHGAEEGKKTAYEIFCKFKAGEELASKAALKASNDYSEAKEVEDARQAKYSDCVKEVNSSNKYEIMKPACERFLEIKQLLHEAEEGARELQFLVIQTKKELATARFNYFDNCSENAERSFEFILNTQILSK